MFIQQIKICFLFAATYFLEFTLLLFAEKKSFTSLSIANKMAQTRFAEMHLPREYGRESQLSFVSSCFLVISF